MNSSAQPVVPPIPLREATFGPLIGKRVTRFFIVLTLVFLVGFGLTFSESPNVIALGVGMQFPGAGFLYTGGILGVFLFLLTLVFFGLAAFAWFGAGMIVAPPIVWGLAALGAYGLADNNSWNVFVYAVPTIVVLGAVVGAYKRRRQHLAELEVAKERNRYLAKATSRERDGAITVSEEMSPEELASLRFVLDLGLQPLESFEGFDFLDQFQSAATRYQVDYAQYGLAIAQFTRTPAFTGYMQKAQENLIKKKLDKRMWSYWFLENLWGNFRFDADPIRKDNVMYSGNTGLMIGLYETVNQDYQFSAPGSMPFKWNDKKSFVYDFGTISEAVARNYRESEMGLMVCEPNWLYNMCNCIGMSSLVLHDRLHGTRHVDAIYKRWQQSLNEEFLTGDGRCVAIRSSRLGITLPGLTSMTSDANFIWYLNALDPGHADRLWAILRKEFAKITPEGELDLTLVGPDKMDVGTYKGGCDMGGCTVLMETAAEMGDLELWNKLKAYIEKENPPVTKNGVRRFEVSTILNTIYIMGLFARPNVWRDLINNGMPEEWKNGPLLSDAPYPDVLVAKAVSDGTRLDLVLRPGSDKHDAVLKFQRLKPDTRYKVEGMPGAEVVADGEGCSQLAIELRDRLELSLIPA